MVRMKVPKISVVMPLFNKEDTLVTSVYSVLQQECRNFELIVVNDGSTDNSCELLGEIDDNRLKIISQSNKGVSSARNIGIQNSSGEYVAFIDADDLWDKGFLTEVMDVAEKFPECSVYCASYKILTHDGREIYPKIEYGSKNKAQGVFKNYFRSAINGAPPINSSCVMMKRKALEAIGGFPVGIESGEDLLTWARLAVHFKIGYSKKILVTCRQKKLKGLPYRVPPKNDLVAYGLKELINDVDRNQQKYLRKYISLWHKNNAFIFMVRDERSRFFSELAKSFRYDLMNYKLYAYFLAQLLPRGNFLYKRIIKDKGVEIA